MKRNPILFLLVTLVAFSIQPVFGQDQPGKIRYLVDLKDAKNHYVTVELTAPAQGDETELMMAVWTPGSYLVREYARHLDSIHASDLAGNKLAFKKTKKNRWTVVTKDIESFRFRYRLYCNELSVRTNWVGREYAILNGAPTFLTLPDKLDWQHEVKLKLPRNWRRSATSLNRTTDGPQTYVATSFHELVDSPIVAGNISVYPFEVGEVTHQLVNIGESGYWDGETAASDLAKVVKAHHDMWQTIPYDRYLFLNAICGRGGGLEHDNSTLIMTSRWSYRDTDRYTSWLSLASHEFFHTWNVRRLRPKGLANYDYENETYTRGLWVAEGVTSYYEDLLLLRAGLIDRKEFLKRLNSNIDSVQKTPGRLVQSLSESSYDAWIKFYRSDENSSNTRISYYSKGAVVAFLLDGEIRSRTAGEKSLDDAMRLLYQRHLETGYSPSEFRAVVEEVAGESLNDWFAANVDSTAELDFSQVKEWFGMKFPDDEEVQPENEADPGNESADEEEDARQDEDAKGKEPSKAESEEKNNVKPGKPWLGFAGVDRVTRVEADSPATEAGINTGDEILAINGFRVSGSLDSRLKQYEIGDKIELLISRQGKVFSLPIKIGSRVSRSWKLGFIKKPTDAQKGHRDAWLVKE